MIKENIQRINNIVEYPILLKTIFKKIPRDALKNLLFIKEKLKFIPKDIIDVGAADGQWSKAAHYLFPDSMIYLFEPIPESYENLKNIFKNENKLKIYNCALDNKSGDADFHLNDFKYSSSILEMTEKQKSDFPITQNDRIIKIKSYRFDSLEEIDLSKKVLMKIDVQGLELRVLEGFGKKIENPDIIILEMNLENYYKSQPNYAEIFSFMYKQNFEKFMQLNKYTSENGNIQYCDILFYKNRIFEK